MSSLAISWSCVRPNVSRACYFVMKRPLTRKRLLAVTLRHSYRIYCFVRIFLFFSKYFRTFLKRYSFVRGPVFARFLPVPMALKEPEFSLGSFLTLGNYVAMADDFPRLLSMLVSLIFLGDER